MASALGLLTSALPVVVGAAGKIGEAAGAAGQAAAGAYEQLLSGYRAAQPEFNMEQVFWNTAYGTGIALLTKFAWGIAVAMKNPTGVVLDIATALNPIDMLLRWINPSYPGATVIAKQKAQAEVRKDMGIAAWFDSLMTDNFPQVIISIPLAFMALESFKAYRRTGDRRYLLGVLPIAASGFATVTSIWQDIQNKQTIEKKVAEPTPPGELPEVKQPLEVYRNFEIWPSELGFIAIKSVGMDIGKSFEKPSVVDLRTAIDDYCRFVPWLCPAV